MLEQQAWPIEAEVVGWERRGQAVTLAISWRESLILFPSREYMVWGMLWRTADWPE